MIKSLCVVNNGDLNGVSLPLLPTCGAQFIYRCGGGIIKKPKSLLNEHDVIRFMGRFPDKITTKEDKNTFLLSKRWDCSICGKIYEFDEAVRIPSPCEECGGIFFIKK